jgi:hypothetical protein
MTMRWHRTWVRRPRPGLARGRWGGGGGTERRLALAASRPTHLPNAPLRLASEGAATADAAPAIAPSLATLLTRHILRDGELVLLILRPSLWFVPLSGIRFIAAVLICMIAATVFAERVPGNPIVYVEVGIFLIAGRLMWGVLQWMGRLYVLTDLRIVRLAGVFAVDIFDCPLRKVARTRLIYTTRERVLGVGSIEIIPQDEEQPAGVWQTIAKPRHVHQQVLATIRRARQGGCG